MVRVYDLNMAKTLAGVLVVWISALLFAGCGGSSKYVASASTTSHPPPTALQSAGGIEGPSLDVEIPHRTTQDWSTTTVYVPSTTTTTSARPKFDQAQTSCKISYGIVEVNGWVRNNTSTTQSYSVDLEVISKNNGVRIDTGSNIVWNVSPGQTALWTVYAADQYSDPITCSTQVAPI